jgi:nucleotidyltransferase/DNA polymerase involved in DNA repair
LKILEIFRSHCDKVEKASIDESFLDMSSLVKQKLLERLVHTVQDAMQFFEKLGDKKPEEREKELHAYREKAQENLTAFLQGLLQEAQSKRLRQVMLQREGLFALGNAAVMKELEITDKQRLQFAEVVQKMQKKIEPLMKEAQQGGNPEEIRPNVLKIREEHRSQIEKLLSDAQKEQWKQMLGKPLDLAD